MIRQPTYLAPQIDVDALDFIASHGVPPKGRGAWAFQVKGSTLDLIWTPAMTYSDAKVWVKAKVRALIASGALPHHVDCYDVSAQP